MLVVDEASALVLPKSHRDNVSGAAHFFAV